MRSREGNWIQVNLPKPASATETEHFYIDHEIFTQVPQLLQLLTPGQLQLGVKFCRNTSNKDRSNSSQKTNQRMRFNFINTANLRKARNRKKVVIKQLNPDGEANEVRTSEFSQSLRHSILIHHKPENLSNPPPSCNADDLGVYVLCEATKIIDENDVGIGFRAPNRRFEVDTFLTSNCVVKFLVYLAPLEAFQNNQSINFNKEEPTLAVYKRIKGHKARYEVVPYLGPSLWDIAVSRAISIETKVHMCIAFFEYIISEYTENKSLLFHDIKPDNFSYDLSRKRCQQCDKKARNDADLLSIGYYIPVSDCDLQRHPDYTLAAQDLYGMGRTLAVIAHMIDNNVYQDPELCNKTIQDLYGLGLQIQSHVSNNPRKESGRFSILPTEQDEIKANIEYINQTILPTLRAIQSELAPSSENVAVAVESDEPQSTSRRVGRFVQNMQNRNRHEKNQGDSFESVGFSSRLSRDSKASVSSHEEESKVNNTSVRTWRGRGQPNNQTPVPQTDPSSDQKPEDTTPYFKIACASIALIAGLGACTTGVGALVGIPIIFASMSVLTAALATGIGGFLSMSSAAAALKWSFFREANNHHHAALPTTDEVTSPTILV